MKQPYLKTLIVPLVGLIVIIVALVLSSSMGLSYLKSRRNTLDEVRKNEKILLQKRDILSGLGNDVLSQTSLVVISLPDRNPIFAVLSQIKQIAAENSVALADFKMGLEGKDVKNLSTIDFSFVTEGSIAPTVNFVKLINNILPLTEIASVKMEIDGATAKSSIELKSFWSPLPKNIASFTDQLVDLTDEDKNIFVKLAGYKFPSIVISEPSLPSPNVNPFGE